MLMNHEMMGWDGSRISWIVCKSFAPRSMCQHWQHLIITQIFTARRYASTVLGVVILSVHLSVRLSVTRLLCD